MYMKFCTYILEISKVTFQVPTGIGNYLRQLYRIGDNTSECNIPLLCQNHYSLLLVLEFLNLLESSIPGLKFKGAGNT